MEINIKNCKICWTEFFPNTNTQETCKNKYCKSKFSTQKKRIRNVELLKLQTKKDQAKRKTEWQKTDIIKRSILSDMIKEKWYSYCEWCWEKERLLDLHHIIFRSELNNHPKKHCKANSILLWSELSKCKCHRKWHDNKNLRNYIVKERWLDKIFNL